MRILVLGGSYFLGKRFVELADDGDEQMYEITLLNRGSRKLNNSSIRQFVGDRHDADSYEQIRHEKFDAIVDFCAYEGGDISFVWNQFDENNKPDRYVFISTCDVYTRGTGEVQDESASFEERAFPGQEGEYISGKVALETELCKLEFEQDQTSFISIRPAFIYGPDNYAPREGIYFNWVLQAGQILAPTDATGSFQMVFVDDVARAILFCLERTQESGNKFNEAYNLCPNQMITYDLWSKTLAKVLPTPFTEVGIRVSDVLEGGIPLPFPLTEEESNFYDGSAIEELGFTYTDLEEGLRITAEDFWRQYGPDETDVTIENTSESGDGQTEEVSHAHMMDVCRSYYDAFGRPMIEKQFPDYVDRIAVGLCGEGSECFGFDDIISRDHDCGPGFAMWVTNETYAEIGDALQKAYDALPDEYMGFKRITTSYGSGRVGVCTIDGFYDRVLGGYHIQDTVPDWNVLTEDILATATNGAVFTDSEGVFTAKRNILKSYYPDSVWREKLARALMKSAQSGQYNYARVMARGEYVAAHLALSEYLQSTMQVIFLLNKTYMPYYKWQRRALGELEKMAEVGALLDEISMLPVQREAWEGTSLAPGQINMKDEIVVRIEKTAQIIVDTLQHMGLSKSSDLYLEVQATEVMKY